MRLGGAPSCVHDAGNRPNRSRKPTRGARGTAQGVLLRQEMGAEHRRAERSAGSARGLSRGLCYLPPRPWREQLLPSLIGAALSAQEQDGDTSCDPEPAQPPSWLRPSSSSSLSAQRSLQRRSIAELPEAPEDIQRPDYKPPGGPDEAKTLDGCGRLCLEFPIHIVILTDNHKVDMSESRAREEVGILNRYFVNSKGRRPAAFYKSHKLYEEIRGVPREESSSPTSPMKNPMAMGTPSRTPSITASRPT